MYFQLSLKNLAQSETIYKSFYSLFKPISKNKNIELELFFFNDYTFKIELDASFITGRDHAGISFELNLFGVSININFYDSRHWDYENKTWQE